MSRKKKPDEHFHLRLYASQDDDLIQWLAQFEKQPLGVKSAAVKGALRQAIGSAQPPAAGPASAGFDPGELRRVVEAAVSSALAGSGNVSLGHNPEPAAEGHAARGILDSLETTLVLGEDDLDAEDG